MASQPQRAGTEAEQLAARSALPEAPLAPVGPRPTEGSARQRRDGQPGARRRRSLAARTVAFLKACAAELQRMQWPNREHTAQATAVVLGFVIVAGIYLAIADLISSKLVNLIF